MVLWWPIRPSRTNIKKKDVLFIIGDWNAKIGSQEIPGVTDKFGLGVQNEARQRPTKFCYENALVIANTSSNNTREDSTHGHHQMVRNEIAYILCSQRWRSSIQSAKNKTGRWSITSPTKVHLVKAMVFPIVTYGCESWTVKKAECRRIHAFELWRWGRLLRVPWTARRSNQSLKETRPEYSLKGLTLSWSSSSLATWWERLTHLKRPLCWERLKAGGEGDNREWDGWMATLTQWTWVWGSSGSWWWTGKCGVLHSMGSQSHTWVNDWTELKDNRVKNAIL